MMIKKLKKYVVNQSKNGWRLIKEMCVCVRTRVSYYMENTKND